MSKIRVLKNRFVAITLVVLTLIGLSSGLTVHAEPQTSATQRVTNFINLAAGKETPDLAEGLNLTKDELRFLGVYLSNFYIPFGTELGAVGSKTNDQTKEDIKKSLQSALHFSDEIAETFTETVMGLSRSNSQELTFQVSKNFHSGYQKVPNFKVNYYNFLRLMLGESHAVFQGSTDTSPQVKKDIYDGKYDYGYFGYEKNGTFVPMFDCSLNKSKVVMDSNQSVSGDYTTPSMYAFYQCLASVDIEKGYGFNFFDFNTKEAEDDGALKAMLENLNDDEIYRMSAYGSSMNVDCFGNIIVKGGNHQFVAVPGCMNPYTWVTVDEDGNDYYQAGTAYNMVTFQGLGLADTDNFVEAGTKVVKDKKSDKMKWVTISDDKLVGQLDKVRETFRLIDTDGSGYPLRMLRGSTDKKLEGVSSLPIFRTGYFDLVEKAESGFKKANKDDYSYYAAAHGGLKIPLTNFELAAVRNYVACWNSYSRTKVRTDVRLIDNLVMIDNLGAFGFDNSKNDIKYSAIQVVPYLNDDGKSVNQLFGKWGQDAANGFTNMYSEIQSGKLNTTVTAEDSAIVGIYTSYALAGLYENNPESKSATIGFLGYRLNNDGLVAISKDPITLPNSVTEEVIKNSIRDWTYYLLHPTKGASYVSTLFKTKVSAILVGWHNDMVGTNGVGATTGTTKYKSNFGYVTTPDLSEMTWTNSLMNFYKNSIPFLIVLMIVSMTFAYVASIMSIQKCLFGVVIFACFLLTPVTLINGVVGVSNRVTQNIYGEKFTYWALAQQESYADALDTAATGASYSNYLKTLYATNNTVYSNQGSDSIVLKWQAPKKMSSLMLSEEDTSILNGLSSSSLLNSVLGNSFYSGESYLDGENSYMYRSYTDIGNFSRFIYNGIVNGNQDSRRSLSSAYLNNISPELKKSTDNMGVSYKEDRDKGYSNTNGDGSKVLLSQVRNTVPLTSAMYSDAIGKEGTVKKLGINDFVGIHQEAFNFSVAMFNNSTEDYKTNLLNNASEESRADLEKYLNNYADADLTGLASYSLMSESPFYYFSWGLYDMGMSTGANATNGFKSLLLGQDNGGFFYNTIGNGELKDFMDMKSLFTYTIPYLKEGNDLVKEWDNVYGTKIYEEVPTEEGHWDDTDIKNSKELKQKYWHNLNVARLYGIYTPWVDLMYDCGYAKSETISVFGEKVIIKDPINPASYPTNRPMIFSESEMADYGLTKGDLTTVERKILDCNEGMEKRLYELLNYYNFSDLTLNTAAAINCTFEFNTTFSEAGIFKNNVNLYPQSFEISDFSYDAFLRFVLSNSLGEDMTNKADFYSTVVEKSSWTTAIAMIVLDILSQYVLPGFKIFFLIIVFISAILLITVTSFKVDPEQKFIPKLAKSLIVPMLSFLAITVGFAWVISLFMGVGNNAVTKTNHVSISMGDPVMVMLAMAVLDIICIIVYFFICRSVFRDIKQNFKGAFTFISGAVGGALSVVGNMLGGFASKVTGGSGMGSGIGSSSSPVGRESVRASSRAENNTVHDPERSKFDEKNPSSSSDTKRNPISNENSKEDSKTAKGKKDSINKKLSKGLEKMSEDSSKLE